MSEVLVKRDIAYSALQGVASSYLEQRQKNVLRHNDQISVTDPALALAAVARIDAPGLSPGDLAPNARLWRLFETRWSALAQVHPSEVREITLRVSGPVAPSSAPVSLPVSSAAPTSNSSVAGLAMTPTDFHVPSAEPRRVPGSPFRRDHLTPVTRPSVHVSASSSVPRSGSAASAAPVTSSAGLVSSMVVTSAPESTARPLPAVSAGSASSAPPSTRRASLQVTKASAGSTSKSARKSPTEAAVGLPRRAPRNSAASPSSTSTVAPAPPTGSACSQRASALNARAINSLGLQGLETSDAEDLGWSSGAASSAARATSASSPLMVDSPSPPAATPTPVPVVTPFHQRLSSSDDSADDEVILQRSRRLRKKSVVESDESSYSIAEALEEKPASPLTPAPVLPAPSTGLKRPSSPVMPAPTKKARASSSAKASSPPRPCWPKSRGDHHEMAKVFVALYERTHWLVNISVVLGLHPDLNPTSSDDELALAYQLWQKYSHEHKRRSDALRSVLTELYGTLYKAVTEFDAASNTPAPQLDSELYFDPSVPFAPPATLSWFPTSADWCEAVLDIDVGEPW
ncbi:unnamed protein product [Phytophthora fragariaefolia]|uniref:Unnamed protein product n=1 Tax=Phytophthora fragariaefolia TaxID=1490495 RepID=A0A9W6XJR3_9STRA|nr:unnamed protein product [Phytophthora fragariaefolia]